MRHSKSRSLSVRVWKNTSNGNGIKYWDGWRRDPDLCFPDADCLVYFHHEGQSQRGPSIQVPLNAVLAAKCTSILPSRAAIDSSTRQDKIKLYLAPPSHLSLTEAQRWNITTRNFFAWMLGKPLVGEHLGPALESLLARMKLYRGSEVDNLQDILLYAEQLGYLDFTGQPEYALALLYFSEKMQIGPLWVDSFTHCMGMDPYLAYCTEMKSVSRNTKTSLTRAYLSVQLKIEHGLVSLGNLLEVELSAASAGLTFAASMHLIEFRAFLYSYCSATYGCWPPPKTEGYPKVFLESMRADFEALYHYLADHGDITGAWASSLPASEISLSLNIEALNSAQDWDALPYSSPLLPQISLRNQEPASRSFFRFERSNKKEKKAQQCVSARQALQNASNRSSDVILSSPLVQAYEGFECDESVASELFVSLADGRKIRWLLVYGILQKLLSLTTAPAEVSDSVSALYPLCCDKNIVLPWEEDVPQTPTPLTSDDSSNTSRTGPLSPDELEQSSPPISVHPDCEAMGYYDFKPVRVGPASGNDLTQTSSSDSKSGLKRSSTLSILSKASWLNRVASMSVRAPKSTFNRTRNGSNEALSLATPRGEDEEEEVEEGQLGHEALGDRASRAQASECSPGPSQDTIQRDSSSTDSGPSVEANLASTQTKSNQTRRISPPKLSIPPLLELDEEEQSSPSSVEQDSSPISSGCSTISTVDDSPIHSKSPNVTYLPIPMASSCAPEKEDEVHTQGGSHNPESSCILSIPQCQCTGVVA